MSRRALLNTAGAIGGGVLAASVLAGPARRSCSLTMFDSAGASVSKYFLQNAWPSKLELSGVKAGSNEVLTETVTLTMESLHRVAPDASVGRRGQNIPLSWAEVSGMTWRTSQCSTILPSSSKRKMSMPA